MSTSLPPVLVDVAQAVDDELVEALSRLLPQLSSSAPSPTNEHVAGIIATPATTLFVARDATASIIGSLTLASFTVPTGARAIIEDVVVDERARGTGVGAALVGAALEHARALGVRSVDLTSRPSREAANRLYVRLGFVQRSTNVYRIEISD